MEFRPTVIERAYQLAASGECPTISDVRARLGQEGYANITGHLYGPTIQAALRKLCTETMARAESEAGGA